MYTLRVVFNNSVQVNVALGEQYTFVAKETSPKEFDNVFYNDAKMEQENYDNCYGFVIGIGGRPTYPLYKNQFHYIMTDSGKTFANLSER